MSSPCQPRHGTAALVGDGRRPIQRHMGTAPSATPFTGNTLTVVLAMRFVAIGVARIVIGIADRDAPARAWSCSAAS